MNQKRTKVPSLRQYLHNNTTKTMLNWIYIAMSRLNLNRTMRQLKKNSNCSCPIETHHSHRQGNNSKMISKSRTTKDETRIVKKEFAIFEVEGKPEANLDFITKILIQST
jgi:hypothetical protein